MAKHKMSQAEKVLKLKEWSKKNYMNGADTFVECWSDADYIDTLESVSNNYNKARSLLKSVASVYLDRQRDAINSTF